MDNPKDLFPDQQKARLRSMAMYWDEVADRDDVPVDHCEREVMTVIHTIGYFKTLAILRWFVASFDEPEPGEPGA